MGGRGNPAQRDRAGGAIETPLLTSQLDSPEGDRVREFPVPIGGFGQPEQIGAWVEFMLSPPAADFLCGSVVTVDGGTEPFFRGGDWPRPVSIRKVPAYLLAMRRFNNAKKK